MENYPRLFIKAGLIYALLGAILGVAMAIEPSLSGRVRFVHIHLNLLGFMTMMVAGVAFSRAAAVQRPSCPLAGGREVSVLPAKHWPCRDDGSACRGRCLA